MKNPVLTGEVLTNKMLKLTNPRLRRTDIVSDSFRGCVSDAAKEFSRAPEMSVSEIISEPRMLLHQTEGTISFEQLQGFADTHGWRQFNKQMDVINSDMKLVDFTFLSISNLPKEKLTIHPQSIKLERVHSIFNFPDKMESILSEAMLPRFQIHFKSPNTAHANIVFNSGGLEFRPSHTKNSEELNFEGGDSSQNLKVWVSSPQM